MINKNPCERDLRIYAAVLGLILTLCALLSIRNGTQNWRWLGYCIAYCAAAAAIAPNLIQPVFHAWLRLAMGVAAINTLLISALLYYVFITPYALLQRMLGKDPLDERMDNRQSYWHTRSEAFTAERYERQF